ncbi:TetR/AcrR family transcriptional regulator [Allokutzneria sp. A3M-2-11 16]|uniref:TetR/AcrR family transcriptional regulator n=1 Tax=Allokutzneria sp. A3M-2-11 16 TaxID=2962043 RepID=UPI0020B89293|nr:TetR/AcrR family transcriptional regulator [Allokutzneria sp. A3M-2-11 16]MCP3804445.1 TetR/AcrR family transcriptional regulator [Allokutzneria sp. A3M-2-11 16]
MDPRKARTLNALLTAAEEIFRTRSVDDVTVEEIAERAGVAVGSIYNNFGSKAGLHAAVVERAIDDNRGHMDRAYLRDGSPNDRIRAAAEAYLDFYLANPDYFRMLAFPQAPGQYAAGRELATRLARAVDEQNARLVATLREGVESGRLRPVEPEEVATVLWAAWNGIMSLHWRPDELRRDDAGLRRLLAVASDVVSEGLLPR